MRDLVGEGAAAVTLLSNGELDTLALGQGDPGLVLANDENVALTGGESVVNGVLDVDDGKATVVALAVGDDTDTAHVATTGDHGDGASVELDEVGDLASGEVNLDGVVDLDERVRVADAGVYMSVYLRLYMATSLQALDFSMVFRGCWEQFYDETSPIPLARHRSAEQVDSITTVIAESQPHILSYATMAMKNRIARGEKL